MFKKNHGIDEPKKIGQTIFKKDLPVKEEYLFQTFLNYGISL